MDRKDLIRHLMATFQGELQELARDLERDLLHLERAGGEAERIGVLNALFRSAHTLKGAARSVDVRPIETACHHLEDIFSALRDGRRMPDHGLFQLLYQTVDAILEAGRTIEQGDSLDASSLIEIQPRLAAFADQSEEGRTPSTEATPDLPPPASPPSSPQLAAPSPAPAGPGIAEAQIRLPAQRLDQLLARSSQLLLARSRAGLLEEGVSRLQARLGDVRGAARSLAARRQGRAAGPVAGLRALADDLGSLEKSLQALAAGMETSRRSIDQAAAALEAEVRAARMQPFTMACEGLERIVRDLTQEGRKSVQLVVSGGQVEIDRAIIEALRGVLRHLVRNAIDHGAETREQRRAAGKPEEGRIAITARLSGEEVQVLVEDDGQGLDLAALREQAAGQGKVHAGDQDADLAALIFQPGVSTARVVTEISGRGVGLDAARATVEALRGDIAVTSTAGQGTRFSIRLPLTVTTTRALLVECGGQTFAIESLHIRRLLRVGRQDIREFQGRSVVLLEGVPVPVVGAAEWLGLGAPPGASAPDRLSLVLLSAGQCEIALVVDALLHEDELVIRSLGPRLAGLGLFAGATILPSGRFALVINPAALEMSLDRLETRLYPSRMRPEETGAGKRRLLVADDSITTRTLEQTALTAAGYDVVVACDGAEAWALLQEKDIDLVVSDVEMPHMDGIALTRAMRGSETLRAIPVILVTARETEADKVRGLDAGADAYLVKSAFDQQSLLDAVARLL